MNLKWTKTVLGELEASILRRAAAGTLYRGGYSYAFLITVDQYEPGGTGSWEIYFWKKGGMEAPQIIGSGYAINATFGKKLALIALKDWKFKEGYQ